MKQRLILASASVLALAAAIVPGCGDHVATTTDPLTPGAGGSASTPGGAGAGNQVAAAGTGGATPGAAGMSGAGAGGSEGNPAVTPPGSAGTTGANLGGAQGGSGGVGGAPGAAGAGGAPPVSNPSAFCAGSPSDGAMCTVTCTDQCGIHNLGTRLCTCTNAVYDCATCSFAMPHPLITPPTTPLTACELPDDAQEDDETGCTENERCQSIGRMTGATDGANRFCGCLMNEWDCDTKPAGF
jgi:hypothetical protein